MASPLPDQIVVRNRTEWREAYLRSYRLRDTDADTREDTQPWVDASALADQLAILSENARQIGRKIPLSELSEEQLDQRLEELGLPQRFPDLGASGFVIAHTGLTGSHIFSGDELTEPDSGLHFQCITTDDYSDGDYVPVAAIDTGPSTNLAAGVQLVWSGSRPGLFPDATIAEQTDGDGLSGGRLAESGDEVRLRISDTLADPAASGNDAGYRRHMSNSRGHGVPVQQPFTYSCILGPGTIGGAFTLKPSRPGASRVPNATQVQQVRDYIRGQMPIDDGYLDVMLIAQPVDIVIDVDWAEGAAGWTDAVGARWPERRPTGAGAVVVTAATDATHFTLATDNASYSGVTGPVAGQTLGFFDSNAETGIWRRKKILNVSGSGPWVITCDTANASSDTSLTPAVGARVSPWSDSLNTTVAPLVAHFETLGPGEQRATFFDPGLREKRSPASPRSWPSNITNRLAGELLNVAKVPSIGDAVVREGLGVTATVGTPGAISYLPELGDVAIFPLT